jgi:hypothetical protein
MREEADGTCYATFTGLAEGHPVDWVFGDNGVTMISEWQIGDWKMPLHAEPFAITVEVDTYKASCEHPRALRIFLRGDGTKVTTDMQTIDYAGLRFIRIDDGQITLYP